MVESCKVLFISNPSTVQVDLTLGLGFDSIITNHTEYPCELLVDHSRMMMSLFVKTVV